VIVGSGDFLPNLVQQAGELGIVDRVEFTGFLGEERKVEILRQAHVVVNPSAKEGWGVTVTEANACGTPVVASDVPGLRDAVIDGKTGFLVPYGDVRGFASRISQVLGDRSLRDRLAGEAVAWAKTFNWDRSAASILAAIERLAAGGPKR
jgi:glycosyltransferase involved in cell wall biosynthesis